MKNLFFLISAFCCFMTLLSSCGVSSGGKTAAPSNTTTQEAIEVLDGTYLAAFKPLNEKAIGTVIGSLAIIKEGDQFLADIRLNNGNPKVVQRQNIHIGRKCPTLNDDVNGDGYIDIVEARPTLDSVLIPLDGDLNGQLASSDYWPVGDVYGSYLWSKTSSYATMMQDLTGPDEDAGDNITKLNPNQILNLTGKVVVIQGVSETQVLPATVATMGRYNKYQTLPIACGVISKVVRSPGIIDYSDEVRGVSVPAGETVGGSSGANDGSIFRYDEEITSGETTGGISFR